MLQQMTGCEGERFRERHILGGATAFDLADIFAFFFGLAAAAFFPRWGGMSIDGDCCRVKEVRTAGAENNLRITWMLSCRG